MERRKSSREFKIEALKLVRERGVLSGAKVWPSPQDHDVEMHQLPQGAGNNVDVVNINCHRVPEIMLM